MKIIAIVGGGRNVGKTTLAHDLAVLFDRSAVVKLGVHSFRHEKHSYYFPKGTRLSAVQEKIAGDCDTLVIESGSILDDPDAHVDLVIFLPRTDGGEDKPGSEKRKDRADLIRGQRLHPESGESLRKNLGLTQSEMLDLLRLVGVLTDTTL